MEYIFLLENCIYPVGIVGMLTQGIIRNHNYSRYDSNFYSVKTPYPHPLLYEPNPLFTWAYTRKCQIKSLFFESRDSPADSSYVINERHGAVLSIFIYTFS